jgi:hypothetical protein
MWLQVVAACLGVFRLKNTGGGPVPWRSRVSRQAVTAKDRALSQVSPCEICCGHIGIGMHFCSTTLVAPVSAILRMLHSH